MARMTSKERLLATIRHEEPDIVPNAPRIAHYSFPPDSRYYKMGMMDWARELDYDPFISTGPNVPGYTSTGEVKVETETEPSGDCTMVRTRFKTPAGDLTQALLKCPGGREYGAGPNPHWIENPVKDRADFEKLKYLYPNPEKATFAGYHNTVKSLGDGGLVSMRPSSGTPQFVLEAVGIAEAMMLWYDDREFLLEMLDFFHKYDKAIIKAALEDGVEVIFDVWYHSSLSVGWSPQMYRELFAPAIKDDAELIHSYGAIQHVYDDGKCMGILEILADCGVDVISTLTPPPVGDVDLALAKKKVGDRMCLMGNIDLIYVIKKGTPELIREKVREAIEAAASGGGFILSTSDSIRENTPIENIEAYFSAAREFGVRG